MLADDGLQVRVLELQSGELLVDQKVALDQPVHVAGGDGESWWLNFRDTSVEEQTLVEKSVSEDPEEWQRAGYTSVDHPSVHLLRDQGLRLEMEPEGWASEFCEQSRIFGTTVDHAGSLGLVGDEGTHLTPPDWDGQQPVELMRLAEPEDNPAYRVLVSPGDELVITPLNGLIGKTMRAGQVRQDFPMVRHFNWPDDESRPLQVYFTPPDYGQEFCDRWLKEGDEFAGEMAAYFFGWSED